MRNSGIIRALGIAVAAAMTAVSFAGVESCDLGKLAALAPMSGDEFGRRVVISGDTIAVGSWQDDSPLSNAGSVTVYRYVRGSWMIETVLTAPTPVGGDRYGAAVALEDDVLVVGAPEDDEFGTNAGIAFVYRRFQGVWSLEATLKNQAPLANDQFGWSAGISGETIVVGARLDDEPATNTGAVVVFIRNDLGVWTLQAKFKGLDTLASDQFGNSVAIDGDTIAVGAFNDDDAAVDSGTAFIFLRSGGVWTQQAKLAPADLMAIDNFGQSVDVEGNLVVVGCPQDDDAGADSGSAYVFARTGSAWSQQAKLLPQPVGDPSERFGQSVALNEGRVLVGAPADDAAAADGGSLRLFLFNGASWILDSTFTAFDAGSGFGLGAAADIDGDLLVGGADKAVAGAAGITGAAYLFVATAEDCNGNGTVDWCDVVITGETDCNSNGVPDQCEVIPPIGDLDLDCFVNGSDLGFLLGNWGTTEPAADINNDGTVDGADLGILLANWT